MLVLVLVLVLLLVLIMVVAPRAAEMVARATQGQDSHTLKYRGVDKETREVIVDYLKTLYST